MTNADKRNKASERGPVFWVTYTYDGADGQWITKIIDYPTSKENLSKFLSDARINGQSERVFYSKSFKSVIPGITRALLDAIDFDELNYLAARIQALDSGQRELYTSVIEAGRYCRRMDQLINLTENLVNFTLLPADKQTNVEGGVMTSNGILVENGVFNEPYRWPGDIPRGQRAAGHLDKFCTPEPLCVVKDTELSPFAAQLHAVCGDYMADAKKNIAVLESLRSAEYLLLFDERGAFLTEAANAYREGSPANERFMSAERLPDTVVFALHVRNIWTEGNGEPERGPVTGDCVLVDICELQWDIQANMVKPVVLNSERRFTPEDYSAVHEHLRHVSGRHQEADFPEPVMVSELILMVNRNYMEQAEYPQQEKIRVCREAAKEMLARGDANVYRLDGKGATFQNRIGAVRIGINSVHKDVFAINPADMAGFAQWAKRTASDMARNARERGERTKTCTSTEH